VRYTGSSSTARGPRVLQVRDDGDDEDADADKDVDENARFFLGVLAILEAGLVTPPLLPLLLETSTPPLELP